MEHEILRPLFKGAEIQKYYIAENIFYLIFPYEFTNGEMKLISQERMIQRFPSGWNYLKQHEKRLRGRESGRFDRAEWYGYSRPQNLDQFERPKILTQVLSKEPSFSYDFEGKYFFVGGGTAGGHGMTLKSSCHLNYLYVLSLLNSRLLDVFFDKIGTRFRGGYRAYTQGFTGKLPIRRINFTTPPEERTALVGSLKSGYTDNEFDKIIQLVEECLPKDAEGNFITEKEKSDVVHDLLTFLAERMIEMNNTKNEEVKGFLEWFEREIGAKIETLTNRTKLKQYYDLDFGELLDILKKNKKKIPANLSNRELQGNLKDEFEGSMRKLRPLIERIEKTDELIDQVVYRLYGLSEEEVRVVEESK
ncbi:MAG: TaqI-like C-terminal specificity domain-containing protein [Methanosarcinaceae archaeon]